MRDKREEIKLAAEEEREGRKQGRSGSEGKRWRRKSRGERSAEWPKVHGHPPVQLSGVGRGRGLDAQISRYTAAKYMKVEERQVKVNLPKQNSAFGLSLVASLT